MEEAAGLAGEVVGRGRQCLEWSTGRPRAEPREVGEQDSACVQVGAGLCCGCVLRGSAQSLDGLPLPVCVRTLPDTVGQCVQQRD